MYTLYKYLSVLTSVVVTTIPIIPSELRSSEISALPVIRLDAGDRNLAIIGKIYDHMLTGNSYGTINEIGRAHV